MAIMTSMVTRLGMSRATMVNRAMESTIRMEIITILKIQAMAQDIIRGIAVTVMRNIMLMIRKLQVNNMQTIRIATEAIMAYTIIMEILNQNRMEIKAMISMVS